MNRSQLIDNISFKNKKIPPDVVDVSVREILELLSDTLVDGDRIEIRNFGSISTKLMPSKAGRNPKTGERIKVEPRRKAYFKPGKPLKERVNNQSNN